MKHVLIVDDNLPNLKAAEQALSGIYKITMLTSGHQAIKFLSKNKPDLILLDIDMPIMDGFQTITQIHEDPENFAIPIIFLTANIDAESETKGLELGAVDFILKPFVTKSMLSRIKTHLDMSDYQKNLEMLVAQKTKTIEQLQDAVSVSIAELVGCRDGYTGDHVKRTCLYIKILASQMLETGVYQDEMNAAFVEDLVHAAALHDVGKVGIKDVILCKPGIFTSAEFTLMKEHAELGGQTLQKAIDQTGTDNFLYIARDMALYHHEKWDGTGYVTQLTGTDIPLCARIMAVVDVYDALTSIRPYKPAFPHEKAIQIIIEGRGTHFDPIIVDSFLSCTDKMLQCMRAN